jgi:tetratricopeptide (TPR) repeat protein
MPPSRVEMLRSFIAQRPDDPFPRYALALEHKNAGRLDDAWGEWGALLGAHADYVPAYLHAGLTLIAMGRRDEARDVYRRGIEAAVRRGDAHARGELEGALAAI